MNRRPTLNRRCFLWGAAAWEITGIPAEGRGSNETVFRFRTTRGDVRMTVEFFDGYRSAGFWFKEHFGNRRFCLSGGGKEDSNCISNFTGSVAVARYALRAFASRSGATTIREQVRTIDYDSRLTLRPPFERTIELQNGVASDIQAFGFESSSRPGESKVAAASDPWYLFRQDLFFNSESLPFLVVHWKHALSAIRLLDVIPGESTSLVIG